MLFRLQRNIQFQCWCKYGWASLQISSGTCIKVSLLLAVSQGCEMLRIPHCLDNQLTVNCEILATCSVLAVQFVPHRKHTPCPYSKAIPVTGRGGL
jgi:hypothetical protein